MTATDDAAEGRAAAGPPAGQSRSADVEGEHTHCCRTRENRQACSPAAAVQLALQGRQRSIASDCKISSTCSARDRCHAVPRWS